MGSEEPPGDGGGDVADSVESAVTERLFERIEQLPKRKPGRPPGSKNKPKPSRSHKADYVRHMRLVRTMTKHGASYKALEITNDLNYGPGDTFDEGDLKKLKTYGWEFTVI